MDNMTIAQAKKMREELGATRLVLLTLHEDGSQQVVTHGKSEKDARQAAYVGNQLKTLLAWPEEDCHAVPLARVCGNCVYYKPVKPMQAMMGPNGESTYGQCLVEPAYAERLVTDHCCRHFEANA